MRNAALHVAVCALLIVASGDVISAQAPADVIVLTHANVIDGHSQQTQRNMTVVVRAGRIERVVADSVPLIPGARVIDLAGRWLLPGLIDAHTHLRDLSSARRALTAGVTTTRSLGVERFVDVGIRELHRQGAADLPDVLAAGYQVRRRIAEEFFLDFPLLRPLMPGISGEAQVRQIVSAVLTRSIDFIKVMATERAGLPQADFTRRMLTDAELVAAVQEASRAGIRVAAHAHTDEGAAAAVRAGVRTIEHGTLIGANTMEQMRERGVCLVPTVSFWMDMHEPGGEYDDSVLKSRAVTMLPRVRETAAAAWKAGVRVIAGSDMRYAADADLRIADEIEGLVASGLPPMVAIQAGTSAAAECLGIAGRTGAVKVGLEADLIVVDGDPLVNIRRLRNVLLIVNDGRLAVDRITR